MLQPTAQTTYGRVRGEWTDRAAIFRGIPYGGSCEGERRFLPPVPPAAWAGVRECTQNGPIAWQQGGSISGQPGFGVPFSGGKAALIRCAQEQKQENCLVLNVVTPRPDARRRPVVVYLHGGGFAGGSGSLALGADDWAAQEDIVVVSINHRLNVFGFLYLGWADERYAASGMAGMLDCVLALEWVRDNIAAFGGDPARVTLMGESGGGAKINCLLAMPQAKGLFCGAIVESGSMPAGTLTPAAAEKEARALMERLGLAPGDIPALQALPAQRLLEAGGDFEPCFAGAAPTPAEPFARLEPALPLMVGSSAEELAAFGDMREEVTWEDLPRLLGQRLPQPAPLPAQPSTEKLQRAVAAFRAQDTQHADAQRILYRMLSQASELGGAWRQAAACAGAGGGRVYHYLVQAGSPHPFCPQKLFAWHTADLPLQMRIVAWPQQQALSRQLAAAWGAFIRCGDPSTAAVPWPAFTPAAPQVMVWGEAPHIQPDPERPLRQALDELAQ